MADNNPFSDLIQNKTAVAAGTANPFTTLAAGQREEETPPPIEPQKPMPPGIPRMPGPSFTPSVGIPQSEIEAAQQRGQTQEKTFETLIRGKVAPNDFEPTTQQDPLLFRAALARRIDQSGLQDAQRRLNEAYPDGSIIQVPSERGPVTLYRRSETDPYRYLGGGAEFAGSNINLKNAGILAGAVAFPEAGVARAALTGAAGGALGQLGDYAQTTYGGYGKDVGATALALREVGAAAQGASNAIPGLVQGVRNIAQAGILLRMSPETSGLLQSFKDTGLLSPGMGQMAESEFWRGLTRQVSATTSVMSRLTFQQKQSLFTSITKSLEDTNFQGTSSEVLHGLAEIQRSELMKGVASEGDTLDRSQLGGLVQNALQNYRSMSGAALEKEKNIVGYAFKTEGASLSSMPLKNAAAQIERGVAAPGMEGQPVQLAPPTRDIQPYLDTIKAVAPRFENLTWQGATDDAFSQMVAVRRGLYDLMTNSPDAATKQQASMLFDATYQSIRNLEGASPELGGAIRDWLGHASQRQDTLGYFGRMIDSQEPGNVATKLVKSGSYNTTKTLLDTLSDSEATQFKEGFKSDLIANPSQIEGRLNQFNNDKRTLGLVLEPDEEGAIRAFGRATQRLNSTIAAKAGTSNVSAAENAIDLARNGNFEELDKLVKSAGGPASPTAEDIRHGMYLDIAKSGKATDKLGRTVVDPKAIGQTTAFYLDAAEDRLKTVLTPQDIKSLQAWNSYSAVLAGSTGGDVAGSLARGQIISELKKPYKWIEDPEAVVSKLYTLFNNNVWANIMAKPAANALMMAPTEETLTGKTIRRVVTAMGVAAATDANRAGRTEGPVIDH